VDIQDNVFLTPADNRDDLVRRIVAVCEQIPPSVEKQIFDFFILMFVYSEDKHLSE
jgi:hypothetical protein